MIDSMSSSSSASPSHPLDATFVDIDDLPIGPSLDAAIVQADELVQAGRIIVGQRWTKLRIDNIDNDAEAKQISKEEEACDEKYAQDKKEFTRRYVECNHHHGTADACAYVDRLNKLKNRHFDLTEKRDAEKNKIEGESEDQAMEREKTRARDKKAEYAADGIEDVDQEQVDAAKSSS